MNDDLDKFRQSLRKDLQESAAAFENSHAEEIKSLLGLAEDELARITPEVTKKEVYDQLIAVVKEAQDQNLSQAALKSRIESLGSTALDIAKSVTSLAKLLA